MRAVSALWRSTHPGPTIVVTALSTILGFSAGLPIERLAILAAAVFCGQLSVGWSNDAIDAARDRTVGRTDKPIARGEIGVRAVWIAATVAVAAALVLSAVLSVPMLVAHAIAIASAWSYNLGLKRTAVSVVPFIVSFGIFPSLATLSAADPRLAAPWAWAAGAALGLAVHFTNVLPDLDDDAATGVRGLPHRIGPRAAAVAAFGAVGIGALAVLIGPVLAGGSLGIPGIVGFMVVMGVGIVGLTRALSHPDRTVFRLVMAAALLLAIQLAVTGLTI